MEFMTFNTVGEFVTWAKKYHNWVDDMPLMCGGRQGVEGRFNFISNGEGYTKFFLEIRPPASTLISDANNYAFLKKQAE